MIRMGKLANPIEVVAIFFIVFEAHLNVLLLIKVKIVVLIKWSYRYPDLC